MARVMVSAPAAGRQRHCMRPTEYPLL